MGGMMDYNFDRESKKPLVKRLIREVLITMVELLFVIGLAYAIINYAVEKTEMIGASMETTLYDGDQIIINKLSYRLHDPQRFDVIVFKQRGKEHSYYNIKRIIGLPGETVQLKENVIYINGDVIEDEVNVEPMNNAGLAEETITLEENEYFVLGDNRNNSEDSRFANVGNIVSDEIVGKAWIKLKPFNFINKMNLKSNKTNSKSNK